MLIFCRQAFGLVRIIQVDSRLSTSATSWVSARALRCNKSIPFFTDAGEEFSKAFKGKSEHLNVRNSTINLCTEEYIVGSTRIWFSRRHDAKNDLSSLISSLTSTTIFLLKKAHMQVHLREAEPATSSGDDRSSSAR
jgi:hypothetical protein